AIMATDAAESNGVKLAQLSERVEATLRTFLPPEASCRNPVDMIASASPENYERTLRAVLDDPAVDAAMLISVPPVAFDSMDLMRRVSGVCAAATKPVYAVVMAPDAFYDEVHAIANHPPIYRFPENAMRAFRDAARYAEWKAKPAEDAPTFGDVDQMRAASILGGRDGWLEPEDAFALLEAYRLPTAPVRTASDPDDVPALSRATGYPCVLKATGSRLVHKSDVGGVALNLRDESEVAAAVKTMLAKLAAAGKRDDAERFVVQRQAPAGRELLIGGVRDPKIGPVLAFGLGGKYVEVLKDVVFRLAPLTRSDAVAMISGIRGAALLDGVRGEPAVDKEALVELLLRTGRLLADHPSILELDLNPVIAQPRGGRTLVVDVRVRVAS
ncbi:MAG TPA: acetate--CoA ligase family protein, partial [Planctomycetota bacterium]|nr:acetate--CoA ligase family protein [Planctomycetota bacterium]